MKEAWVHLKEWSKAMVTAALEGGADALIVSPEWQEQIRALGRIALVAPDGDIKPGEDVFFESLANPDDEARIARRLCQGRTVVVQEPEGDAGDAESRSWEVIPLENLAAQGGRLLVPVRSMEELSLALGILEKGVSGVVIHVRHPQELRALLQQVKAIQEQVPLQTAIIESIDYTGLGDRVCLDTCTLMQAGEGMLVGNSSGFLFLVQAEVKANPYVAPRPFRVNAGPVHAYLRIPQGKTRYLCELKAGDPVLIVNASGATQQATVGRVKIERRPLLLIEARHEDRIGSILLQNAETIRLTDPGGEARSVVELKPGDPVLVALERPGRHFGLFVDETIREQ